MLHRVMPQIVSAVFALSLMAAARADQNAMEVPLKNFKFKIDEGHSSLFGLDEGEGKLFFFTNGTAEAIIKLPEDGDYEVTIKASCDKALNEFAKFKLTLDGELVGKETALTAEEAKEYKLSFKAKAGDHKLGIAFTNDAYKENEYDRNLYVHALSVKKK